MNPKITFLGTAGDATTMSRMLSSAGIIIEDQGTQVHIDPGPNSLMMTYKKGINIRNTNVLLISRNSILHGGDINAMIEGMSIGGIDRKGVLLCPNCVVSGSEDITPLLSKKQKNYLERVITLHIGDKVGIANMTIKPMKTSFPDDESLGYTITTPKYTVGYTGDTNYSKEIAEQYKGCDILIINLNITGKSEKDIEKTINFINIVKPKLSVITHFSARMVKDDILTIVRKIHKETGIQAVAAKSNFSINPLSYAAKVRQRSLV